MRRDFMGRAVIDRDGETVGRVADTWPTDGGGEPEMLLVKLSHFALRRYVPVDDVEWSEDQSAIHVPWSKLEIDDSPDAEDIRWGEPASVSRAHWLLVGDD